MACPVSDWTPINYGWELSKCDNYLEINWLDGDQVPPEIESLEETNISNEEMFNEYDEDSDHNIYESNKSDNDDDSNYDDFWIKNHLEDLIISYNVMLYILVLYIRLFTMIEWFFKNLRVRRNLRTVTRGVYGTLATFKMELFVTLFNDFVPLTNVIKNSISGVARMLDKPVMAIHSFFNHE